MSETGMSRRGFLNVAATGAAATAGAWVAAGCSVQSTSSAPSASSKGGVVHFAMSGAVTTADTGDPALSNTQHDGRLMTAVYEQLTRYDDSLRAVPWLAESWSHNASGDTWRFNVRQGVKFHNGDRFTAKDVEYSYKRLLDPKTGSPVAAQLPGLEADGVRAVNDKVVEFKLRQPDADLPLTLITKQTYIVPDGATGSDLRRHPVGTGAFTLSSFTPGDATTTFVGNRSYWQSGLPRCSTFVLSSIPEDGSRVAALQRGQVDVIEDPPPSALSGLRGGGNAVLSQPKGNMELVALQMDQAPFDDPRVRLALKYALNRKAMIQLVAQQQAMAVDDIPIASILEYALQSPERAYDIAKAKSLLAQAGHAGGLDVTLWTSNVQARFVDFATLYKQLAADAGINVDLQVAPADTYWDKVWLKRPMFVSAWIARPTPAMLGLLFLSNSANNETHWARPEWDALYTAAKGNLDETARARQYRALQRQVVNEGGYLVPYMHATLTATKDDIHGWSGASGTFFERYDLIARG